MPKKTDTSAAPAAENTAPAPAPAPEKPARLQANGVTRPEAGTTTAKLWDIADRESAKIGKPAPRKVVTDAYMAEVPAANIATANTQYARWVKFYGVSDQLKAAKEAAKAEEAAAKQKAKDDAKAAKEAEKAEKARLAAEAKAAKDAEKAAKQAEKEQAAAAKAAEKEAAKQQAPAS